MFVVTPPLSASLVCKAWHGVAASPNFVPWKKAYYRYMLGHSTVSEGPHGPRQLVRGVAHPGERFKMVKVMTAWKFYVSF